uniref:Uncharacterized protein n=1 Tax=Tanacetum cinerariifolium TaxID=118510 RepID=A0A699I955_TANCI|nr:hypothetical protein [Tanacetum cinerariifolium]
MFDTREAPSSSSKHQSAPHSKQPVEDLPIPDDVNFSDSKDTDTAHLSKIKTRPDWLNLADALAKLHKDPEENKLLSKTGDMGSFIKWLCKRIGKKKLSKSDLEGPVFKVVKVFHENNISLQFYIEECHRLLTDQVDLVNPEAHRLVPGVSKLLPLGGLPDFRLEELVPSLWIESERDYNISAAYGITYWWFKRKEFYITRHSVPFDHRAVRSHIADYNEYKISEVDFKNLHPNDFEDIIESYQTKLNLTEPRWGALDFLFKEAYTIFNKPRVVIYRDTNDKKKMLRRMSMENRNWSKDDKRRSEEFMEVIERRLKI